MVSTFTPNIQLEEPARGDYVGTWDTPVNANETLTDLVVGGTTTISLNNSNVTLSAAQLQCKTIIFNSTLTGSVIITFVSSFKKSYEIWNQCTGSSAFTVSLTPPAGASPVICAPPGFPADVYYDGTQFQFKTLGPVGTYLDYAGSSVPNWVSGCTKAPYLNCDGSTFSSSIFPTLAVILGSTTLPDLRGRVRATLDQGAARLSSATIGFSPTTVGAGGGTQAATIGASNVPAHTHPLVDPGHNHTYSNNPSVTALTIAGGGIGLSAGSANTFTLSAISSISVNVTNITMSNSTYANSALAMLQPTVMGGLTLIRAG